LRGIEKFEGEMENFILNTFISFKPVKRFGNRSSVCEFRSFNNGTSKGVLDLLETMYLRPVMKQKKQRNCALPLPFRRDSLRT